MWIHKRGATRTYKRRGKIKTTTHRFSLGWFTIMMGILVGIALTVFALNWFSSQKTTIEICTRQAKPKQQNKLTQNNQKPRFEFYNLLPEKSINLKKQSTNLPQKAITQKPKQSSTLTLDSTLSKKTDFQYRIQVASFYRKPQADELRAKLTLSGFHSSIETVKVKSGKIRFRVLVGPYTSQKLAARSQKQLATHKIRKTLIIQQPK